MVASKTVSVKDGETMTPGAVREYVEAVRPRYLAARKKVKRSEMLTEFCQTTGYHRDTAIRLLGHPPGGRKGARQGRPRSYGTEVREDLKAIWEAADRICSKRLQPFVPTLLESLERHGEINLCPRVRSQLLAVSAATMDRREIHTDNGGEFLNDALYPWCQRHGIRFTRGRPYKKNDQAYVEQKNWTVVRRVVGYDRFASKSSFEALERVYCPLRLYINFFQPLRKLVGKERVGSKVVKRYDEAKTPYQRLTAAGVLDPDKQAELERLFRSLNPVRLRTEIDAALEELWKLAERPAGANGVRGEPVACA